jgi:hypothetical protein
MTLTHVLGRGRVEKIDWYAELGVIKLRQINT